MLARELAHATAQRRPLLRQAAAALLADRGLLQPLRASPRAPRAWRRWWARCSPSRRRRCWASGCWDPPAGALAGLALLSCALFVAFARYVRPEICSWPLLPGGSRDSCWRTLVEFFRPSICGGPNGPRTPPSADTRSGPGRDPAPPDTRSGTVGAWAVLGCVALGVAALAKDPLGLDRAAGRHRDRGAGWRDGCGRCARGCRRVGLAFLLVIGFGWYAVAAVTEPGSSGTRWSTTTCSMSRACGSSPTRTCRSPWLEFLAAAGFGAFPGVPAAACGGRGSSAARLARSRGSCRGSRWRSGRSDCSRSLPSRRSSCRTMACPPIRRWRCSPRARGATRLRGRKG